ncbi:MAG: MarR family transcriptional regulator [Candidatus Bathyarchaeota archaeon]|nr:MarR family transcriptional regulator [Candidatus Bathyarchaeota archaeon]
MAARKAEKAPKRSARGLDEWRLLYETYVGMTKLGERALVPTGVTFPQMGLLEAIWLAGSPQRVSDLAGALLLETQSAVGLIDRLEARRLVRRFSNPADRRSVLVDTTAEGRRAFDSLAPVRRRLARDFFGSLTPEERKAYRSVMRKLRQQTLERLKAKK